MTSIEQILAPVKPELFRVQQVITECLQGCDEVDSLLDRSGVIGGKMIRASLVLLSGCLVGKLTERHIKAAAAIELAHNASLLHDDVLDASQKRRGKATVNLSYGNEVAILLGDLLLGRCLGLCASVGVDAIGVLAEEMSRTCQGEISQSLSKKDWQLNESEYIQVISDKSAALFRGSCKIGAMLCDADEQTCDTLGVYGLNFGIAFQIADDITDITGHEKNAGKTLGTDLVKSKATLPVIHLLETLDEKNKLEALKLLNNADESKQNIRQMLDRYGSITYSQAKAKQYSQAAVDAVSGFEGDAKDMLVKLAGVVTENR
jgi:octaprenyl-diphosphate synthase